MSVYTATVGCPACREAPSGHCAQHPPVAAREGSERTVPSGQRRYFGAEPATGDVVSSDDFELLAGADEGSRHGPLGDPEPPSDFVSAGAAAALRRRRDRPSKGWRRHLRKTKALKRAGSSGS